MTLAEMQRLANADQKSRNARQHMAGAYATKALRAIAAKDWDGATQDAIRACERSTNYAPLLTLIDAARRGSITSKARAAASRANGAKGGRPRSELAVVVDAAITYLDHAWPDRAEWPTRFRALTARRLTTEARAELVADAFAEINAWDTDAGRALADVLRRTPD